MLYDPSMSHDERARRIQEEVRRRNEQNAPMYKDWDRRRKAAASTNNRRPPSDDADGSVVGFWCIVIGCFATYSYLFS
jgi:hypothetical protein